MKLFIYFINFNTFLRSFAFIHQRNAIVQIVYNTFTISRKFSHDSVDLYVEHGTCTYTLLSTFSRNHIIPWNHFARSSITHPSVILFDISLICYNNYCYIFSNVVNCHLFHFCCIRLGRDAYSRNCKEYLLIYLKNVQV